MGKMVRNTIKPKTVAEYICGLAATNENTRKKPNTNMGKQTNILATIRKKAKRQTETAIYLNQQ